MRGDPLVLCRQGRPPGPRRVDRAPSPACICLGPRAPVVEWAVIRPSAREPDLGPGSRRPTPAALGLTLALSVCKPPSGRRRVRGEPPPPRGPHSMSRVCRDPYCLLPARGPPGGGPARDASRLVWRLPHLSPSVLAQRVCVSPSRVHVIDVSPVVQWGLPGSGLGGLPAGWWFGCRLAGPLAHKSLTALCRGQGPLPRKRLLSRKPTLHGQEGCPGTGGEGHCQTTRSLPPAGGGAEDPASALWAAPPAPSSQAPVDVPLASRAHGGVFLTRSLESYQCRGRRGLSRRPGHCH